MAHSDEVTCVATLPRRTRVICNGWSDRQTDGRWLRFAVGILYNMIPTIIELNSNKSLFSLNLYIGVEHFNNDTSTRLRLMWVKLRGEAS